MDKIIDDARDYLYVRPPAEMRQLFCKFTECETAIQADKVVMTQSHFLKLIKHMVGDKHSSREIE